MRVFLSYASEQRPLAEHLCRLLESEGLDVFFDREDLAAGDAYGARIRKSVERSHLFVFLVSHDSIARQSYARTELAIVETVPPRRRPQILPVLVEPVDLEQLPALVKPVTLLEPQGNLPAEVAARIGDVRQALKRRRLKQIAAAVAVSIVAGTIWWTTQHGRVPQPDTASQLNDAVRDKVPATARVGISGMLANSGWMVNVQVVGFSTKEIFYRVDGEESFKSLGVTPQLNPMTGLPQPNTTINLNPPAWKDHDIAIKYVDDKGKEFGPYLFHFDPKAEYVRETRDIYTRFIQKWVSFREYPKGELRVYFSNLLSYKNAFREIRYSVDSDDLDKRVEYVVDWSANDVRLNDKDQLDVTIPMATKYVAMKLFYIDGSASELRRFVLSDVGVDRD